MTGRESEKAQGRAFCESRFVLSRRSQCNETTLVVSDPKDDVPGTSEAHDMPAGLLPVHVQKRVAGTTATRAPPAAVGRPPGGRYRGLQGPR